MSIQENEVSININNRSQEKKWKKIAYLCLIILAVLFIGYAIYSYVGYDALITLSQDAYSQIDEKFLWMLLVGFMAQMVDGALGMGYGVVSTTLLFLADSTLQ